MAACGVFAASMGWQAPAQAQVLPAASINASTLARPPLATRLLDPSAGGSQALELVGDGGVYTSLTAGAGANLTVTVRSESCQGAPSLNVYVDGQALARLSVSNADYQDVIVGSGFGAGAHALAIWMGGGYQTPSCSRHLYLTTVAFTSPVAPVAHPVTPSSSSTDTLIASNALPPLPTTSWQNTPIPNNAPLASNSAQLADGLAYMVGSGPWKGKGVWGNSSAGVNINSQTPPVWIAEPATPTVKVGFRNCQSKTWIDPTFMAMVGAVPIPAGAAPSAGSDQEMVVYQPSTDTEWDLWKTLTPSTSPHGDWEACWGGKLTNMSKSLGQMPRYYGVAASGLALQVGLISPADLRAGVIKHVIAIAVPLPQQGAQSWPANRNDGWANGPHTVMEGQRFRLDPTIDVTKLGLTPLGTMIAKAGQTYGFVVRDFSTTVTAYAVNSITATSTGQANPYTAYLGGKPGWDQLTNLPWSRLVALPQDYGKP